LDDGSEEAVDALLLLSVLLLLVGAVDGWDDGA
jgi:hypothetical protein